MSSSQSDSTYESDQDNEDPTRSRQQQLGDDVPTVTGPVSSVNSLINGVANVLSGDGSSRQAAVGENGGNVSGLLHTLGAEALSAGRAIEHVAENAVGRVATALGLSGNSDAVNGNGGLMGFEVAPEAETTTNQNEPGPSNSTDPSHPVLPIKPPTSTNPNDTDTDQEPNPENALTSDDILAALANAASDEADKAEAVRVGVPRAVRIEKGLVLHGIPIEPITTYISSITAPLKLLEVSQILDRNKTPKAYYRIDTRVNPTYDPTIEMETERERTRREKVAKQEEERLKLEKEKRRGSEEKEEEERRWEAVANEGRDGVTGGSGAMKRPSKTTTNDVTMDDGDRLPEPEDLLALATTSINPQIAPGAPTHAAFDAPSDPDPLPAKKFPIIRELRIDIRTLHPAAIFYLEDFRRQEMGKEALPITMVEYIQNWTLGRADPLIPVPKVEPEVVPKRERVGREEREAAAAALAKRREEAIQNAAENISDDEEEDELSPDLSGFHDLAESSSEEERRKRRARRNRDTDSEREFQLSVPGGKRTLMTARKRGTRARSAERTPTPPRASRYRPAPGAASGPANTSSRGRERSKKVAVEEEEVEDEEARTKSRRKDSVKDNSEPKVRSSRRRTEDVAESSRTGRSRRAATPEPAPQRRSRRAAASPSPEPVSRRRSRREPEPEPAVTSTRRSGRGRSDFEPVASGSRKRKTREEDDVVEVEVVEVAPSKRARASKEDVSHRKRTREPSPPPKKSHRKQVAEPSPPPKRSHRKQIAEPSPPPKRSHRKQVAEPSPPPTRSYRKQVPEPSTPPKKSHRKQVAEPTPPPKKSHKRSAKEPTPPPKKHRKRVPEPTPPPVKSRKRKADEVESPKLTTPKKKSANAAEPDVSRTPAKQFLLDMARRKAAAEDRDWVNLLQGIQGDVGRWEAVVLVSSVPGQELFLDTGIQEDSSDEILPGSANDDLLDDFSEEMLPDKGRDGRDGTDLESTDSDNDRSDGSLPDLPPITTLMKGKGRAQARQIAIAGGSASKIAKETLPVQASKRARHVAEHVAEVMEPLLDVRPELLLNVQQIPEAAPGAYVLGAAEKQEEMMLPDDAALTALSETGGPSEPVSAEAQPIAGPSEAAVVDSKGLVASAPLDVAQELDLLMDFDDGGEADAEPTRTEQAAESEDAAGPAAGDLPGGTTDHDAASPSKSTTDLPGGNKDGDIDALPEGEQANASAGAEDTAEPVTVAEEVSQTAGAAIELPELQAGDLEGDQDLLPAMPELPVDMDIDLEGAAANEPEVTNPGEEENAPMEPRDIAIDAEDGAIVLPVPDRADEEMLEMLMGVEEQPTEVVEESVLVGESLAMGMASAASNFV